MAVNPYTKNTSSKSITPWSTTIELAASGKGCDGLFNLYTSLGDRTAAKGNAITGAYTVPTILDGPEKVVRFGELEVGNGSTLTTFTTSNRCKGLVILCDKLTVKANATIHMTGKGARVMTNDDPMFPIIDYKIPFKISLDSSSMSLSHALGIIKSLGLAPWDVGTFQHVVAGLYGFNLGISLNGSTTLLAVSGCGVGAARRSHSGDSAVTGTVGGNGSSGGTGGGGGAGSRNYSGGNTYIPKSGSGCPYSGGSATGSAILDGNTKYNFTLSSMYSGPGGHGGMSSGFFNAWEATESWYGDGGAGNPGGSGAPSGGNPGGNGCGGKLTIICRSTITVESGSPSGKIEANGMPGGGLSQAGAGGSGGGHISLISLVVASNSGTIQCVGGAGGAGSYAAGGAGGKGSVGNRADGVDKYLTFADMGW